MAAAVHTWLAIVIGPLILIFLGVLLVWLIWELRRLSRNHEFPAFESSWGGLGRGLGGWNVNRMMVFGVLALLVLLMFGSVSFELLTTGTSPGTTGESDKKAEGAPDLKSQPTASTIAKPESTKATDAASEAAKNSQPDRKE